VGPSQPPRDTSSLRDFQIDAADHAVDFGEGVGVIGGVRRKLHFFCMDLPYSDECYVTVSPREATRVFLDAHGAAFVFFDGASVLLVDNIKIAAERICGDAKRG
jgi:transposase